MLDSFSHPLSLVWAGLAFFVLELVLGASAAFDFFLFGVCLITGGLVGNWVGGMPVGIIVATLLTLAHFLFLRPILRKLLLPVNTPTNADALMGQLARVTIQIANDEPGQVRLDNGELWLARSQAPIAHGLEVKVVKITGNSLWVEKFKKIEK
jgi:membrane protein implicated in regulation of membrane protease activity